MMAGRRKASDATLVASGETLNWEASYAIALALMASYPEVEIETVSLGMIFRWTIELPGFEDDPELANDEILTAIYQEWFEEVLHNE